jgi:hypothetical protein
MERATKKAWVFDGSVTTDGVSVSLQYSKHEGLAVLGVDPGRSNLATVTYLVDGNAKWGTPPPTGRTPSGSRHHGGLELYLRIHMGTAFTECLYRPCSDLFETRVVL